MKQEYRVRKWYLKLIFFLMDSFLSLFFRKKRTSIPPPKKILVCNLAHLGDVVIATSVLPVLKEIFPNCKIGFLLGSWAFPLLDNHPLVDWIHLFDHYQLNRFLPSFWKKIGRHFQTKKKALLEIKKIEYDLAIDLYSYFPNAIPLLYQAKIPVRIGHPNGGFGPLLTHLVNSSLEKPVLEEHFELLQMLSSKFSFEQLVPSLQEPSKEEIKSIDSQLPEFFKKEGYLLFHIGAGDAYKKWPLEKWQELVSRCVEKGACIVIVGKGKGEEKEIESLLGRSSRVIGLSDLKWGEFLFLVQKALFFVGHDSVGGHVAGAMNIPALLIFSQVANIYRWKARGEDIEIITHFVSCGPCYKKGCQEMSCIKKVRVDDVFCRIMARLREI